MRGARSYRRVVTCQGRIHVARTLRQSMMYDGIPFNPVLTSQRNEKPRIVVICDVSLSVRNPPASCCIWSTACNRCSSRCAASCSSASWPTPASTSSSWVDEAITAVFSGELIDCDANSNYGRALEVFCQRHLGTVTGQTTVIILGDGRGNRNPQRLGAGRDPPPRQAVDLVVAGATRQLGARQFGHAPLRTGLPSGRGGTQSQTTGTSSRGVDPPSHAGTCLWLRRE